jgi:copper chaperone
MDARQTHRLEVKGMSCQHCVKAVTQALQDQDGQAIVHVDLPLGHVTVETDLSLEATIEAITAEGYEVMS